jgi:hypothetical protein
MFKATGNKGFHMVFRNGITVSVQWGAGNYATGVSELAGGTTADSAEVMIWDDTARTLNFGCDEVKGYLSPDQVSVILTNAAASFSIAELETRLQAAGFVDI